MTQITNSEQEGIFIPIDDEIGKFNTYLQSMDRAILSARFGDGKSTFLGKFSEKYGDDYIFFTIYPLNYQVAENKDIFEYIKRDLVLQLFSYAEFSESSYSATLMLWSYFNMNKFDIINDIIDLIPNIEITGLGTKTAKKPLKILLKNIKRFLEHKEEIVKQSDKKNLEEYTSKFDHIGGSIYEFDMVSQLICSLIREIKKKYKKDIVLIIEDLDRVDPAHIFRLLNILSAHIERKHAGLIESNKIKGSNKFDFDKILLVCDYDNIKHIYHHFYGEKTDFRGYISKFSSQGCFKYSLREKYEEYISDILNKEYSKYPNVVRYVVGSIVKLIETKEKVKNSDGKEEIISLRYVVDNINAVPQIRNERILVTTEDSDKEYYISSINPLTKMLDIINRFEIDIDVLLGAMDEKNNHDTELRIEIMELVNCNLLNEIDSNYKLKIKSQNGVNVLGLSKLPFNTFDYKIQIDIDVNSGNMLNHIKCKLLYYFHHTYYYDIFKHCQLAIKKACDYLVADNVMKKIIDNERELQRRDDGRLF